MKVEDILVPLTDNEQFRRFDKLIQPPFRSGNQGAIVHATLVGRFFAGRQIRYPKATQWGGYGHMGCCSLMAIQEIKSVDGQHRDDLDYGAAYDQPDTVRSGCGSENLTSLDSFSDSVKAQREADLGQRNWAFEDPRRVATDALAQFAHVKEQSISGLKEKRKRQGRRVYEWNAGGKKGPQTFMIVVSRPYLLSFYAHDPKRIAWVVAAAHLSSCDD